MSQEKKRDAVLLFLLFCLLMFLWGHVCEAMTFSDLCLWYSSEFTQRWPFNACYMADSPRETSRKWARLTETWGGDMEIYCMPSASLMTNCFPMRPTDGFSTSLLARFNFFSTDLNSFQYAMDNYNNDYIYSQWDAPVLPLGFFMRTMQTDLFFFLFCGTSSH